MAVIALGVVKEPAQVVLASDKRIGDLQRGQVERRLGFAGAQTSLVGAACSACAALIYLAMIRLMLRRLARF